MMTAPARRPAGIGSSFGIADLRQGRVPSEAAVQHVGINNRRLKMPIRD